MLVVAKQKLKESISRQYDHVDPWRKPIASGEPACASFISAQAVFDILLISNMICQSYL